MVEGAVAAALASILSLIVLYRLPQGGSVTLASVVPIWIVSLRRGALIGAVSGLTLGVLNFLQNPQVIHPVQPFLDYPLAFACLGIAGLFPSRPITGAILSVCARFGCHFLSGVIFFSSYADAAEKGAVIYSFIYNLSSVLPDLVLALLLYSLLQRRAPHLFGMGSSPS